jgi:hypothetical protein
VLSKPLSLAAGDKKKLTFGNIGDIRVVGTLECFLLGEVFLMLHLDGDGATWGRSVLQINARSSQTISRRTFLTDDLEDTEIGEVELKYATVVDASRIPKGHKGGRRWMVLSEGIKVNGTPIQSQQHVDGVP